MHFLETCLYVLSVVFVVEKTLPGDVNYVTMSYTFFHVEGRARSAG